MNNGKWNEDQIISDAWVQKSLSPKDEIEMKEGYEYGYLFWLADFDNERAFFMLETGGNKVGIFSKFVLTSTYFNGETESHNQAESLLSDYIVSEIKKFKT